jgi:hypothetical protein
VICIGADSYLLSFAAVVFARFRIQDRLIVEHSASDTLHNVLAHERIFRVGIASDLFYCLGTIVLLVVLYVILRPVNQGLALFAALARLAYALAWALMTVNLLDGLRLMHEATEVQTWEAAGVMRFATFYLRARFDQYYVGLLFCGIASAVCGYLWFRSEYIPRPLTVFGMVASAFCAVCTAVFLVYPDFAATVNLWWFDTPMGIFDLATSFWLLFRGLRVPLTDATSPKNRGIHCSVLRSLIDRAAAPTAFQPLICRVTGNMKRHFT